MTRHLDVRTIVLAHLVAEGYDGLVSSDGECGCELTDLMPCEEIGIGSCRPGYKTSCPPECGDHHWHISETRGEGAKDGPE